MNITLLALFKFFAGASEFVPFVPIKNIVRVEGILKSNSINGTIKATDTVGIMKAPSIIGLIK